ncbi:hypothetical protein GGI07_002725 [Coemansia sp. Benny D115]|nr:hypothetical protein GGI07_002725 [Coemansia sp. Benny D115]
MRLLNRPTASLLVLLGTLLSTARGTDTLEVFHSPLDASSPGHFVQRGELSLSEPVKYTSIGQQSPATLEDQAWAHDPSKYLVLVRSQKASSHLVLPVARCKLNGERTPKETFIVHAAENGDLLHIDYDVGRAANCASGEPVKDAVFATEVVVKRRMQGATPELAAAASIDTTTGQEKQPEPQKSFLVKYWYYIVPIVLMLLLDNMDLEIERELLEATTPASNGSPDTGDSQIDKMLGDAMTHIDGLMLVRVSDQERRVLFREAVQMFHEPRFEYILVEKCYDAFDDIKKLQVGSGHTITLIYGAMQVVQFRVDNFYGTIVCDSVTNLGLVHNLANRIRACLQLLSDMNQSTEL